MILLIDNYDSFTFNLYQMIEELGFKVKVVRNDAMTIEELVQLNPSHLVISPGPGRPEDAGITLEAIKFFGSKIPVLGVCLGHQAIAQVFGGDVIRAPLPFHGKCSTISHDQSGVFQNVKPSIQVARYHSLVVDRNTLPACLITNSQTEDGLIMGLRHQNGLIEGVQFHPESYATEEGHKMLQNFLEKRKSA
ncbi:MAG: anthranilate synthase component II [Bacteriovoracaceae bacterium]